VRIVEEGRSTPVRLTLIHQPAEPVRVCESIPGPSWAKSAEQRQERRNT